MADRNMQFPHGQGFGMMQGTPQYIQPGAPVMPQQRMMMPQGQGQVMFQGQSRGPMMSQGMFPPQNVMGMRMPPARAPPPYSQSHAQNYQQRMKKINTGSQGRGNVGKTEEQIQKERKFHEQQARLKQFGKSTNSMLDPNKLIDSMFQGQEPPKPRTIKKNQVPQAKEDPDDSFGDFLSSPQVASPGPAEMTSNGIQGASQSVMQRTTPTPPLQQIQQQPGPVSSTPQVQPKDLTKMMFESCDLTAPQKAKLFQKPSLKDINATHKSIGQMPHHDSNTARKWSVSDELSDLFIQEAVKDEQTLPKVVQAPVKKHVSPTSKHPPKPPPWLTDEKLLPALYKQVLEAVLVDDQICTERLYPILMLSGLAKETMGHLWSLCNKITPGQLKTVELYQLLGLIGLTQNNFKVETTDMLSRCPFPPVPFLGQAASAPASQPVPQSASQPSPAQSPPSLVTSGLPPSQPTVPPTQTFAPTSPIQTSFGPDQAHVFHETHFPSTMPVQSQLGPTHNSVSSPATLPVTQLPPAVVPQGMMGNVVNAVHDDDDEFADFQAAPTPAPSVGPLPNQPVSSNIPVTSQARTGTMVPIPDDKAIAASLPPNELTKSTVDNFFGSDDSSEATSPDDDYFDGYKSADSKPSDSTSQFSTDQSEGEDFRNFENYLDEFQRKKEQLDKESPLHRPVNRFLQKDSPTKSPNKVFSKPVPIQKIPLPGSIAKPTSQTHVSSDEFSDFADFQSAPVVDRSGAKQDNLKASASASDLIGDEDKYAALRVLDFSSPPEEEKSETVAKPETEGEENWADFQTASGDTDQTYADFETASGETDQTSAIAQSVQSVDDTKIVNKDSILNLFGKKDDEDDWAAFESSAQPVSSDTGWSASFAPVTVDQSSMGESSENTVGIAESTDNLGDWSGAQNTTNDDFADFQGSSVTVSSSGEDTLTSVSESSSINSVVNVKKEQLGTSEILGLFKVKEEPKLDIKSLDDDFGSFETSNSTISENINKMHGISSPSSRESSPFTEAPVKRPTLPSEDDDFMKPPPLDMGIEDDDTDHFGGYSRGYDLEDIMQPKVEEKKKVYGVYGINQNFVVTGHKKESKNGGTENKNVTIEITKDSDIDNDSDSVSSKDNDTFRGKFGLGKELGEDSQSVSSLDFVVNKRLQTLKDTEGVDNQSVSSGDFGNFETGYSSAALQESKSVDSLELRGEEVVTDSGGSHENSDKESKDNTPDRDNQDDSYGGIDTFSATSLPVVGDRYSSIMHDIPGSDKHAAEWQTCLGHACHMIQDANNIFNSISSSSVCNDVIKSTQGAQYTEGVIEIYKVACRITVSATKAGIHSDKLTKLLKDIDLAWNNLTAFLVGGSVMPDSQTLDFSHGVLLSDDTTAQYRACGVCLLDVEMRSRGSQNDNAVLEYGGRQYHSPCANFWINCVGSTLPALKLLELL